MPPQHPFYFFLNNSTKNQPILIIFDEHHPEEIGRQKNTNMTTSPTNSCYITLGRTKQWFSTIL